MALLVLFNITIPSLINMTITIVAVVAAACIGTV